MKLTDKNLMILKEMGFTCDYQRTKDPRDKEWFSLDNGWGFRIDAFPNIKALTKRLYNFKEG